MLFILYIMLYILDIMLCHASILWILKNCVCTVQNCGKNLICKWDSLFPCYNDIYGVMVSMAIFMAKINVT